MSLQRMFSCLAGVAALGLAACGEAPARVTVDLSPLWAQAEALALPLNQVRLIVSPDTAVPGAEGGSEVVIPVSEMSFELEVSAGPWIFEAVGERTNVDPPVPTYFGDLHLVLEPLSETEVLIPMFPAGVLEVEVTVVSDYELPSDALIRFVPVSPRRDQSESFSAPFVAGKLNRILPTGLYAVRGQVSFDGTNFVALGNAIEVLIEHGQTNRQIFVIE